MKRRGLFFLLLSGSVLVCCCGISRRFHPVQQKKTWTEAQRLCRETFKDLATIQDVSEHNEAWRAAQKGKFWIGLFNSSWTWSQRGQEVSTKTWFTSWDVGEPRLRKCVTISSDGRWSARDCGDQHHMICFHTEANQHLHVKQMMNWSDARTHCRTTFTDLSSITNQEENDLISELLQNEETIDRDKRDSDSDSADDENTSADLLTAWIGLRRKLWVWSDKTGASYRKWADEQPDHKEDCVVMDVTSSSADWFTRDCNSKEDFLCYTVIPPSMLRSVKVRLSGGSVDLNEPKLQDAILQQLKQQLEERGIREEVKLGWRRQPDGHIFHREEERAPPAVWEEEDAGVCVTSD